MQRFTAVIREGRGGGAYIEVPFDVEQVFGDKRPAVRATADCEPFASRLVRMGKPCHVLGVPKDIRTRLGKGVGDALAITLELDTTPRVIDVPDDLQQALSNSIEAQNFFNGLSYTHRKEYARWIVDAKKPETRQRRIAKTIEMLRAKQRGV